MRLFMLALLALLALVALVAHEAHGSSPYGPRPPGLCYWLGDVMDNELFTRVFFTDYTRSDATFYGVQNCRVCMTDTLACVRNDCSAACGGEINADSPQLESCTTCANQACVPALRTCTGASSIAFVTVESEAARTQRLVSIIVSSLVVPLVLGVIGWLLDKYVMGGPADALRKYGLSVFTPEPVSCLTGCVCPTCLLASSVATAHGRVGFVSCLPMCCCLSCCPVVGPACVAVEQEKINKAWGGRNMCCWRFMCTCFCLPCSAAQMSRAVTAHAVVGGQPHNKKTSASAFSSRQAPVVVASPVACEMQRDDKV